MFYHGRFSKTRVTQHLFGGFCPLCAYNVRMDAGPPFAAAHAFLQRHSSSLLADCVLRAQRGEQLPSPLNLPVETVRSPQKVFDTSHRMPPMLLVLEGLVLISHEGALPLSILGPGDLIGDLEFLSAQRRYMHRKQKRIDTMSKRLLPVDKDELKRLWQPRRAIAEGTPLTPEVVVANLNYDLVMYLINHSDAPVHAPFDEPGMRTDEAQRFETFVVQNLLRKMLQTEFLSKLRAGFYDEHFVIAKKGGRSRDLALRKARYECRYREMERACTSVNRALGMPLFPSLRAIQDDKHLVESLIITKYRKDSVFLSRV